MDFLLNFFLISFLRQGLTVALTGLALTEIYLTCVSGETTFPLRDFWTMLCLQKYEAQQKGQ